MTDGASIKKRERDARAIHPEGPPWIDVHRCKGQSLCHLCSEPTVRILLLENDVETGCTDSLFNDPTSESAWQFLDQRVCNIDRLSRTNGSGDVRTVVLRSEVKTFAGPQDFGQLLQRIQRPLHMRERFRGHDEIHAVRRLGRRCRCRMCALPSHVPAYGRHIFPIALTDHRRRPQRQDLREMEYKALRQSSVQTEQTSPRRPESGRTFAAEGGIALFAMVDMG